MFNKEKRKRKKTRSLSKQSRPQICGGDKKDKEMSAVEQVTVECLRVSNAV